MKNCSSNFLKVQSSTFFYIFHLSRQILPGSWNDTARLYHLFVRKLKTTWVLNGSKSSMAIIDFFEGDIFSHIFFWEEVQTSTTIGQRSLWSFIGIIKQQIFHKYFQNKTQIFVILIAIFSMIDNQMILQHCMVSKTSFKINP